MSKRLKAGTIRTRKRARRVDVRTEELCLVDELDAGGAVLCGYLGCDLRAAWRRDRGAGSAIVPTCGEHRRDQGARQLPLDGGEG